VRALIVDPALRHQAPARRRGRRAPAPPGPLPVQVRQVPVPVPQAPGWVLVTPALAGICAGDLNLVSGAAAPSVLSAYEHRAPVIPGHEVVGVVAGASSTRWAKEGDRVLVEPTLRCTHKGLPECARCRAGDTHLCENRDRAGALCSGPSIGNSERAGGGWSEGFLAHEDMLVPADTIPDQRGVLAEPLASAVHAVLHWHRRGDRAAVLGAGAQARLVVASLRRLHPDLDITVLYDTRNPWRPRLGPRARRPAHMQGDVSADFAAIRSMGASRVLRGSGEEHLRRVAEILGARVLAPQNGALPVLDGGVDAVFDCHASAESLETGVRLLRAGGMLVLAARPSLQLVEWPLIWARELTVVGSALYGRESSGHRTFAIAREWLADTAFPIDSLVTHRFPLEDHEAAISVAVAGVSAGAVKVVFEGPAAEMRVRMDAEPAAADQAIDVPLLLHATSAHTRTGARTASNGS